MEEREDNELVINLIDVNHSGFNREIHQENLLRGLTFQVEINGIPYEYRAKEVSSTGKVLFLTFNRNKYSISGTLKGVRGVCSSEKKNEEGKTCHGALLFIPRQDKIPIAEVGTKKSQKKKFGLSPGLPSEVLFDVENWVEAVHRHRGDYFQIFNSYSFLKSNILIKFNFKSIVPEQLMKTVSVK